MVCGSTGRTLSKYFTEKPAVLKGELDVPTLKIVPVGLSQDGEQNFVPQLRLERLPVDIEEVRVDRCVPVLQHILPPWIIPVAYSHVIGNDVEYQAPCRGV